MWWNKWPEIGESIGSFLLTISILFVLFVTKLKSFDIKTQIQKRVFLGFGVAASVAVALIATKGFGGHGQINPAITLIVAGIEGGDHWKEVPALIGMQLLGGLLAGMVFLLFTFFMKQTQVLEKAFTFNNQSVAHTATVETAGNVFWLIPIAGMVLAYIKKDIDFFELAIAASLGKGILVGIFEEVGTSCFNAQVWFGKFFVTMVVQKGKITRRQFFAEMSGLVTNLGIGYLLGLMGNHFPHISNAKSPYFK